MAFIASIVKYLAQLLPLLLICWEYRLKYIDKDGRTIEHRKARTVVLILAICIFVFGFISTRFDDVSKAKKERELTQSNTHLNRELVEIRMAQTNLPKEVSRGVNELLILATNSSISDAALTVAIREKEAKASEAIPINTDSPDFSALAANYEEKLKLTQLKNEKDRREAEKAAQEAEKAALIAAQKATQEAERQEDFVAKKTSPVFDYAIRTLHSLFTDHVRQSGEKNLTSTYAGLTSVTASSFENLAQLKSEGKLPWICDVSRTKWPRTLLIKYADSDSKMTNALSGIRLMQWKRRALDPQLTPGLGSKYVVTLTIAFEGETFETISTSVTVISRIAENFPAVEDKQPYTNYVKSINSALGAFFGAQAAVAARIDK